MPRLEAPKRGEIGWIDLNPTRGHEINKRRPVLVLSPQKYNAATGMIVVCPITSTGRGTPLEVVLEAKMKTTGFISVPHVRSLDWQARRFTIIEEASTGVIEAVQDIMAAILLEA